MSPLMFQLSGIPSSVYTYSGFSNLLRQSLKNQDGLIDRCTYTHYFLPNEHPLVQLVSFMNIDPNWDFNYLCAVIEMKYDRWASQLDLTCVYNKGVGRQHVLYQDGFYEHLVAAPPSFKLSDYLKQPEDKYCPIIPIYSTDTHIDFLPYGDFPKHNKVNNYNGYAVIAIDIAALAIGYWRYLNSDDVFKKASHYLMGYPTVNAKLLANRLGVINVLYEHMVNDVPLAGLLKFRKPPQAVIDTKNELVKYFNFLFTNRSKHPIISVNSLLKQLNVMDELYVDNRVLMPGKYSMYSSSNWVWQLPVMKLYILIRACNNKCSYKDDFVVPLVSTWTKFPHTTWSKFINDEQFKKHFIDLYQKLIAIA